MWDEKNKSYDFPKHCDTCFLYLNVLDGNWWFVLRHDVLSHYKLGHKGSIISSSCAFKKMLKSFMGPEIQRPLKAIKRARISRRIFQSRQRAWKGGKDPWNSLRGRRKTVGRKSSGSLQMHQTCKKAWGKRPERARGQTISRLRRACCLEFRYI